jgi:hypothetical protein
METTWGVALMISILVSSRDLIPEEGMETTIIHATIFLPSSPSRDLIPEEGMETRASATSIAASTTAKSSRDLIPEEGMETSMATLLTS